MIIGSETKNINDLRVKLIDFGMSKHTKHGNKKIDLNTYCGTIHFMAPEVLEGKTYDQTCDIWSIGVIAYMCLAGMPPFKGKNDVAIHKAIITNDYDFDENIWSEMPHARDFVESLLKVRPSKRLTPEQALKHEWLNGASSAS